MKVVIFTLIVILGYVQAGGKIFPHAPIACKNKPVVGGEAYPSDTEICDCKNANWDKDECPKLETLKNYSKCTLKSTRTCDANTGKLGDLPNLRKPVLKPEWIKKFEDIEKELEAKNIEEKFEKRFWEFGKMIHAHDANCQ